MTNKEAIKWLESIDEKYIHGGDEWYDEQRHEAIKTAIKTLENETPKGEWIFDSDFTVFGNPYGTFKCSCCGGHSSNRYSFCKDCGASMGGGNQ